MCGSMEGRNMELELTNPKYIQLLKLGNKKALRWTKPTISIPTLTSRQTGEMHQLEVKLYADQLPVVMKAVDYTSSLIEAQTGAGKTVMAIALHQAWGGKTLVACHSLVLTKQVAGAFNKFTDIKPTFYCNGKHDMTGEVVITTHTTLRQKYKLFIGFDNLVIDEADLTMTDKAIKAVIDFKATRKVGFTGTTKTIYDDCNREHAPVLGKFWGKHIKHISDEKTPLKGVKVFKYNKEYPDVFPRQDYVKFRKVLDKDIDRKKAQLKYITDNATNEEYSLSLFDRVDDVDNFYLAFKKRGYTVYKSTGEMKKADREQHLAGFTRTGGYMIGVSATLNRGYDEVKLSKAFIMFPVKGENTLRQIIGRIIRTYKDKESYLYLWSDSSLSFQLKEQKRIIKQFFNIDVV